MKNMVICGLVAIALLYLYKTYFLSSPYQALGGGVRGYGDDGHYAAPLIERYENSVPGPVQGMVQEQQVQNNQVQGNPGVSASEEMGHNAHPAQVVPSVNRTPSSCFPQKILTANELLPHDDSAAISDFNQDYPIGEGVKRGIEYLNSGYHIGVDTVGQSLRNANRQIRGEPPNPQVSVSPWLNSTIGPDLERRSLDGGESCSA
tara:strand:+ start:492 stop:1103 length:612 start_codon:yes stop_codon:yes gene_type:complete